MSECKCDECNRRIEKLRKILILIVKQLQGNGHNSSYIKKAKKDLRFV